MGRCTPKCHIACWTSLALLLVGGNVCHLVRLRISLYTSQVAHQSGAYLSFRSMKRQGVFVLPPRWDASSSQGYLGPLMHLGGEAHGRVKYLAHEHNIVSPARTRIRTTRSGDECTNDEAIVRPEYSSASNFYPFAHISKRQIK